MISVLCMCMCVCFLSLTACGDQVGSGAPRFGLASQQQGYIMHTHHAVQEVVLASGTGLLTQVPAIVSGLLGVLPPGLNSMLVNRLLSVPAWLGE